MDEPRHKLPFVDNLKFDPSLRLSDENLEQKLKDGTRVEERSNEQRLDSVIGYPEPLDFALFASAAYQDRGKKESESQYEKRLNLPKGWKLLTTATNLAFKGTIYGYFGAAYWQPALCRVVIAHRGTVLGFEGMKFKNLDAVRADLMGIVGNKYVKQMDAACTFAEKIRKAVEKVERDTETTFEIFFTGHSLGAWLAQVTTFSLKYLTLVNGAFVKNEVEGYHAHTVVFDSPGCKTTIEKMIEDLDVRCADKSTDSDSLDITSYLSSPNFVNCCNPHVGKVFRVYPRITSHDYVSYTISSHSMKAILSIFQNVLPMKEVVDWPLIKINLWPLIKTNLWPWRLRNNILGQEYRDVFQFAKKENRYDPSVNDIKVDFKFTDSSSNRFVSVRYQTKAARTNECSFNVFNHSELQFLERFQLLKFIPNSLFEGQNISEEYKPKIVETLNKLILNSKEETVRCQVNFKVFRLIPYVKTLLRLYPDLNERAGNALTDLEIRKQIYTDITKKYRHEMERLTNVLLSSDWPEFVDFLGNEMIICHVSAQYGTDSAMAKVLKVIETKAPGSTLFAFELRNLDTTETFFHLTKFLKSSENVCNVLIAIECEAGSLKKELNLQLVKKLQEEINTKLVLITDIKDQFNPDDNSKKINHGGITWHELTHDAQTETISKNLITFQGNPDKICLQSFISQPTSLDEFAELLEPKTLMQFLKGEDVYVGREIPTLDGIYIHRKFKYNPYIKEEILNNERVDDVMAVLDPNQQGLDNLLPTIRTRRQQIQTVSSDKEFDDLCQSNSSKNVHCLKVESNSVVWNKTKGKLDLIRKNLRDESLEYSVEQSLVKLEDASRKTLIISDAPGMGKSTVLAVLAEEIKKRTPRNWVIRVNLNDCATTLKKAIKDKTKLNDDMDAAKFLSEQILHCSEDTDLKTAFERKLFEKSLTTYGGIVLIFDAFDEISPDYEGMIIRLLEKLRSSRLEKIVLTTRPHTKEQLEDQLATLSHTMAPFSREDQKNFLITYWKKRLEEEAAVQKDSEEKEAVQKDFEEEKAVQIDLEEEEAVQIYLEQRAEEWIDHLKKSIDAEEGDFLGIPLQCQLLAGYTFDKIKNGENGPEVKELSLMELYEDFVRSKMEIYEKKYLKTEGSITVGNQKKAMSTSILKTHREYALRLVLSTKTWESLNYQKIEDDREIFDIEVGKAGLMLKTGDNPQFIHRTFAEFFVMNYFLYLAENKTTENERKLQILSTEILLQPELGVLRTFLDGLIRHEQKQDETTAILSSFARTIAGNWTVNQILCLNGNGDTVFHVLISSKNYSVFDKLLKILIEEKCPEEILKSLIDTPGTDSLLALHIASSHGHLETVQSLANHGGNINGTDEDGVTPLLAASRNGHLGVVRFLKEAEADINSRDKDGVTPLLAASKNGHLEVVRFLTEAEADINSSDKDGVTPLLAASKNGHLEVVRFLTEAEADINSSDKDGVTPLLAASRNGHIGVVRFLKKAGADINSSDKEKFTPIIVASLNGHLEVVRFLKEAGADINSSDNESWTPIAAASNNGHGEVVSYLFENGADMNVSENNQWAPIVVASMSGHLEVVRLLFEQGVDINCNNYGGLTPIMLASMGGHLEVVRFLVQKGADINSIYSGGSTPIIAASCRGHTEVVRFLCENGAHVNCVNEKGLTPLSGASSNGYLEIVRVLLENGADINSSENNGMTPIIAASNKGHLEIVRFLLEKGADINSNVEGWTPLIVACEKGHAELIYFLIENGAYVNSSNNHGMTPITFASLNGQVEVVRHLLEKGADINSSDNEGWTPILLASRYGHLEIVRLLLENGGNINSRNNNEDTPIILASSNGHLEVVRFLFENDADINSRNNNGDTPISVASPRGHLEVVRFLIENDADSNSRDNNGFTSIILASFTGHLDVVRFLLEKGADINSSANNEYNPIIGASLGGHTEVVRFLCENGADINYATTEGLTPINGASMNGHLEVVRVLLENGADINSSQNNGYTPIIAASKNGHLEIVRFLLEKGADINSNVRGWTPITMAIKNNHRELIYFLVENGAKL